MATSSPSELTTALSRLRGATVIAASSALTLKGKPVDIKQLGSDLGVRYALEGSVLRSDGSVRINARLVDTQTAKTLWSDRFDVSRADTPADAGRHRHAARERASRRTAFRQRPGARQTAGHRTSTPKIWRCSARPPRIVSAVRSATPNYELCERALSIDPRNVRALVQLATILRLARVAGAKPRPRGRLGAGQRAGQPRA